MSGAVWPKVLYGLEISFMGKKYFDQMRREATNAILGEYHQTNPFLACNTISKFMVDPQYYVVEKLLLTIRRWYLRQPAKVLDFLNKVNAFRGNKACGPMSSCALYMRSMNMRIDRRNAGLCGGERRSKAGCRTYGIDTSSLISHEEVRRSTRCGIFLSRSRFLAKCQLL